MIPEDAQAEGVVKEIEYRIKVFEDDFCAIDIQTDTPNSSFIGPTQFITTIDELQTHLLETLAGALMWEEPTEEQLELFYENSGVTLN